MKKKALYAAVVAVLVLVVIAVPLAVAWQSAPAPGEATASPTAPASTTAAAPEVHGDDQIPGPVVTWDPASEKSAKATARRALTLFARPRLDQPTWFKELQPLLSPEYAVEAEYILPAKVPVSRILDGPVLVRETGNPVTVTANFRTDHGTYLVLLHRTGQQDPWVVQSIRPQSA